MSEAIAPGWYPDPVDRTVQRYWDGEQWIGDPIPADATPPTTPPAAPPPAAPPPASSEASAHRAAGATAVTPVPPAPAGVPAGPGTAPVWSQVGDRVMVHGRHLAPLGARFMARFVDILVVAGLNLVVNGWFVYQWLQEMIPVYAETQQWLAGQIDEQPLPSERAQNLQYAIIAIGLGLWFAYEVPALASTGQTLGKRLFHIKVIRHDGRTLGFGGSFWRWFVMAAPNLVFPCLVPLQVADALWCTWDRPLRQCLHDKRSQTVVVQLGPPDRPGSPAQADQNPTPTGGSS